jgi:hypothetical protein
MPANDVTVTALFCPEGDRQAFEKAIKHFEEAEWIVSGYGSSAAEILKALITAQIDNLIRTTGITVDYDVMAVSKIAPPSVNTDGSFAFAVTLTRCAYTATLNLACAIARAPYQRIIRLITVEPSVNGRVMADQLYAATRDLITLTVLPDAGYQLDEITAFRTDVPSITVPVTGEGNTRTFIMPPYVVTVTATFTVGTGIDTPQAGGLKAFVQQGVLHVSGATAGETVRVYNILGTPVYASPSTGEELSVPLPGRGVYIVTDGKKVIKIAN